MTSLSSIKNAIKAQNKRIEREAPLGKGPAIILSFVKHTGEVIDVLGASEPGDGVLLIDIITIPSGMHLDRDGVKYPRAILTEHPAPTKPTAAELAAHANPAPVAQSGGGGSRIPPIEVAVAAPEPPPRRATGAGELTSEQSIELIEASRAASASNEPFSVEEFVRRLVS